MTFSLIFALFSTLCVGLGVVFQYYTLGVNHAQAFPASTVVYIFLLAIIYGGYKSITSKKDTLSFSPFSLLMLILGHIFVLSLFFFGYSSSLGLSSAFVLWFKIIFYAILPLFYGFVFYGFGKKSLQLITKWTKANYEELPSTAQFLGSFFFGLAAFLFCLCLLGLTHVFNLLGLSAVVLTFCIFSYKEILQGLSAFYSNTLITFDQKKEGNTSAYQLSSEWLFIFLSFLISINLISIVRPSPIGWDDLGFYMNLPRIMAQNEAIPYGFGMLSWSTFTAIGHLFNSAVQSFFLNDFGGIAAILAIVASLQYFFKEKVQKIPLNLPLLGASIYMAMPMTVFEQAKDMKLDPALMAMSVVAIFFAILFVEQYQKDESTEISFVSKIKENPLLLVYILLTGIFVGAAFAIKVTSLMLLLGIIGLIFFARGNLSGYLGFFFAFLASFTLAGLWSGLSITYPTDGFARWGVGSLLLVVAACFWLWSALQQGWKQLGHSFMFTIVLGLAFILPLLPWFAKNIDEIISTKSPFSAISFVMGTANKNALDFEKIYTPQELELKKGLTQAISQSGTTQNEDLGRYFGYETGLNNYLRLPYNLTHQLNQSGEYTEITYIFLALIPAIFLFFPATSWIFPATITASVVAGFLYFTKTGFGLNLTAFFSSIDLPDGYAILVLLWALITSFFVHFLAKTAINNLARLFFVFLGTYGFIFLITSYGIVWYGIVMYYALIALILCAICAIYHNADQDTPDNSEVHGALRSLSVFSVSFIIVLYFIRSAFPHGLENVSIAGFDDFKAGKITQEQGIFSSHPEYAKILSALNISDQEKAIEKVLSAHKDSIYYKGIIKSLAPKTLADLEQLNGQIQTQDLSKLFGQELDATTQFAFKQEAKAINDEIYLLLTNTPKELRNDGKIYRIGTFLTYFISNNHTRYYEDNLVSNFETYFYDKNPDITVKRLKDVGIKYLLFDLNASTIDRDPRHALTTRFEHLLGTAQSSKIKLVQTDSVCLQLALDKYKNTPQFLRKAGVNSESYELDKNGKSVSISRTTKLNDCRKEILEIINSGKVTGTQYPYLANIAAYYKANPPQSQAEFGRFLDMGIGHGWIGLFEVQ